MLAIFMDIETSGLDPFYHSILEIAFKIIDLSTGEEKFAYHQTVKHSFLTWEKRDLLSIEINGLTWEKIQQGKELNQLKKEIIDIFIAFSIKREAAVYICQNPSFDRNFFAQLIDIYTQEQLDWPYHWLDFASMFWALQVKGYQILQKPFPKEMNLSKNTIAKMYHLPSESLPHRAVNGVDHLILCYQKVVGFAPLNTFEEVKQLEKLSD